jgi:hypothetical protein
MVVVAGRNSPGAPQVKQGSSHQTYCGFHLIVRKSWHSLDGMAAYSIDLRQKILRALGRRFGSQRIIADVFGVSLAFVEKVLRQHRTTGNIAPKPHAGGQKPRLDAAAHAVIQGLVSDHPGATLQELCASAAAELKPLNRETPQKQPHSYFLS